MIHIVHNFTQRICSVYIELTYTWTGLTLVEYGQAAWSTHKWGEQRTIENVQTIVTRTTPKIKYLFDSERLLLISLPSLCHRRKRGDMIEMCTLSAT